jgi:hypothetical protein
MSVFVLFIILTTSDLKLLISGISNFGESLDWGYFLLAYLFKYMIYKVHIYLPKD